MHELVIIETGDIDARFKHGLFYVFTADYHDYNGCVVAVRSCTELCIRIFSYSRGDIQILLTRQ